MNITAETQLVVLTGAGISAESGIQTFRGAGGLWNEHRIEDVATPQAFRRDPAFVWKFYHARRAELNSVQPNPAHHALAELEEFLGERFTLITQNIDDLHQRAGSRRVLPMHGELWKVRCERCGGVEHIEEALPALPRCGCGGLLRPHIVWFGEIPLYMEECNQAIQECDIFLVVGTSGSVYPAAGFASLARSSGSRIIGVNLDLPENHWLFHEFYQGPAGELLPELVKKMIG